MSRSKPVLRTRTYPASCESSLSWANDAVSMTTSPNLFCSIHFVNLSTKCLLLPWCNFKEIQGKLRSTLEKVSVNFAASKQTNYAPSPGEIAAAERLPRDQRPRKLQNRTRQNVFFFLFPLKPRHSASHKWNFSRCFYDWQWAPSAAVVSSHRSLRSSWVNGSLPTTGKKLSSWKKPTFFICRVFMSKSAASCPTFPTQTVGCQNRGKKTHRISIANLVSMACARVSCEKLDHTTMNSFLCQNKRLRNLSCCCLPTWKDSV